MAERTDFLRDIIDADRAAGRHTSIATRFPPEPNGYLHIGHAKSICLNFGIAQDYGGTCNLRFDDTNPTKEDIEYVESIERDVRWLGFTPAAVLYASDYFGRMFELAEKLIQDGKAYVCSLSDEQIKEHRGSLTEPGKLSPFAARPPAESLDLFRRMRAGEFADGAHVLRARIDMAASNMKMRDPLLYRIRHAHHHRTGDAWCLYPMYDYAHPLSDAFEGITHSICTLEFENNRELYDWVIAATGVLPVPHQYEFARLNLDYTVMSKRKLLTLVTDGHVTGWDDPRMPTLAGMRRRGYRPEAIRAFCELIGIAKNNSVVDIGKLEYCVRDDLNKIAPRVLAVLRPLPVTLTNVAADRVVKLRAPHFPADIGTPGDREVPLAREILIERDDFQLEPEKGYLRLAPGRTVRLRHGACITCDEVVAGPDGAIVGLNARLHEETLGGGQPAGGEKVWGVIHWVAKAHAVPAEVRLYDRLFKVPRPEEGGDFLPALDKGSLEVVTTALVEPAAASAPAETRFQFERLGYFWRDPATPDRLVFNRISTLREAEPVAVAATPLVDKEKSAKAKTRPVKRSPAEYRQEARARDPELAARFDRYQADLRLSHEEADLLTADRPLAELFDATHAVAGNAKATAKLLIHALPRALDGRELVSAKAGGAELGALVRLLEAGTISDATAKEILAELVVNGGDPQALAASRGQKLAGEALDRIVADVLTAHADKAAEYRAGKKGLLGFLVGQVVKASGGKADPKDVQKTLADRLVG
jgi:glutaminyl-tRNA synthetase